MNGIDFLADTNFLIHINQGESVVEPFLDYNLAVSFITEIELLGAFSISKSQKNQFKKLIMNDLDIYELCINFKLLVNGTRLSVVKFQWNRNP